MTTFKNYGLALLTMAALVGCDQEYDLSTIDATDGVAAPTGPVSASGRATVDETFEINSQTVAPIADYLFVIDSSVSMTGILKDVRAGLRTLGQDGFPPGTQIAVMTTTPAALDGSGEPFAAVVDLEEARLDPGFQKLIDGESIVNWKNARAAERNTNDGCNGGWFSPNDTNDNGVPCILAITAIPLYAAHAEAGLVSVKQLLTSRGDEPLFRDGAAANIVFISDTHDPGLEEGMARDALIKFRPDYSELKALVGHANVVSSLRVHAIAPKTECVETERWKDIGPSYFDVAEASGGMIFDVCTTTDYSAVLRDVTKYGARPTHGVLTLANPASEVIGVEVNGEAVPFTVKRGGKVVKLDGKLPEINASVKISYR